MSTSRHRMQGSASRRSRGATLSGRDVVSAPEARYVHLIDRAAAFLKECGGISAENDLIAFVFGTTRSPEMWQPLLHAALLNEESFCRHSDGRWTLRSALVPSDSSVLDTFVAIDVETTGLHARTQRIIEVALVRFDQGHEVERFESLVQPGRAIPAYIAKLTGIDNDHVTDAPVFASIAGDARAFLDGALLVGHNVGFDINFLNAEFARVDLPALVNDRVDVMSLAVRLIPELRRPSLDRVASALGLPPRTIHRAGVDARLAGESARQLAERAQAMGIDSLDRIKAIGSRAATPPDDSRSRARSALDRSLIAGAPKSPGVYLMRDADDRVIYIGKAKNLRDRLSSYYSQPLGYTRKMDGLVESIVAIETIETGSELAALLLESQLIRRYQPRYNVVMRAFEHYPFIRIDTASAWPRVTLAKTRKDDGAHYVGPFKNARAAKRSVELVNDHFPLRTCTRTFKTARSYGSPCMRLDLGKCPGPCVGRANRDAYMASVHDAIRFLDGDDESLLQRLWSFLERAAEELDYERARRLRNDVQSLSTIAGAQRMLREAAGSRTLLVVQPAPKPTELELTLVIQGQRWALFRVHRETPALDLAKRFAASWQRWRIHGLELPDHSNVDDMHILHRWIGRQGESRALIRLESEEPDWTSIAVQVLALRPDDLTAAPTDDLLLDSSNPPFAPDSTEPAGENVNGRAAWIPLTSVDRSSPELG